MENKMKKLLLTTALAAVALSGTSFAEIKITGNLEETITSHSYDKAANQHLGSTAIGSEANVAFSGSKTLANGLVVSGGIRIEDKASLFGVDQKSFKITSGNFSTELGIDTGSNIDGNMVATVGQQTEDVIALSGIIGKAAISTPTHDREHIGFEYNAGLAKITLNYAPDASAKNNANSLTDVGGSSVEYLVHGSFGVPGLNAKIGRQVTSAGDESATGATGGDKTETLIGATYKMGKFTVGYSDREMDDETITTETDSVKNISAGFNVSDNVSVAIERMTTSKIGQAVDEELTLLGVSYNMGGLGVEAYYGTASDLGGVSGADGKAYQLRTVFAY
jgi:hypothetical protein